MLCYDAWLHDGPMPANAETGATERESGEKLCSHDPGSAVSTTHLTTIGHRLRGASGVAIRRYGEYCEDFIMSGDINESRGRGSQRDGVWTAETGRWSPPITAWDGMVRPDSRANQESGPELNWSIYRKPGPALF